MPSLAATPPRNSSTASTGSREAITRTYSSSVLAAISEMRSTSRMKQPLDGFDAMYVGDTAAQLRHRACRHTQGDHPVRQRLRVRSDMGYAALGVDELHVERQVGVAHPHRGVMRSAEVEQHAAVF